MTDERLYIDGVLVDLGTDTKITLQIQSNLFRDVSKIVSNTSYTVKLPKTVHNQQILKHTDLVQGDSTYAYSMHTARYFRNGVEIIKDGRASVLAVTNEAIEINLVWGLYSSFSNLVSKGTALNELTGDEKILWSGANTADTYDDAVTKDCFYADLNVWIATEVSTYWEYGSYVDGKKEAGSRDYDSRFKGWEGNKKTYLHPSVKVSWVLKKIKECTGVDFQWTGDEKSFIDTLILPLINKKASDLTFNAGFTATLPAISGETLGTLKPTITTSSNFFRETSGEVDQLTCIADAKVYIKVSCTATYDLTNWQNKGRIGWNYNGCFVMMLVTKSDGTVKSYDIGDSTGGEYDHGARLADFIDHWDSKVVDYLKGEGVIELEQGDKITFGAYYCCLSSFGGRRHSLSDYQVTTRQGLNPPTTFNGGTISLSATGDDDTVPAGGYFPICANLPKVKIIDFVKFLAAITGTFPMQMSSDGIVKFLPLSTVWNNKAEAKDWTRRVIAQGAENKPKQIEFKMSDYAQHNYYKWKNDKYVSGDYDGDIQIQNETLSTERTVIEFPFSASDGNNVPMYEKETDTTSSSTTTTESEPSYSACTDRVLRLGEDSNGKATAYFDINMQQILNDKYREVMNTLQNAKVVTETVRMRDIELLNFDETEPIFLAQYGAFFAVNSIKSDANGLADVELLKLNN